jgi:hypothetical protein
MNPFEAYMKYVAIKNHFTRADYDYFKYHGKVRAKAESFEKRKDRYFFEKLSKHSDIENFLVANLSHDSSLWVRQLVTGSDTEKTYNEWLKRQQSLSYIFTQDIRKLDEDFASNFKSNKEHPKVLKLYLSGEICLETFCILLELTGKIPTWDENMKYDIVWDELKTKIIKYSPFLNYEKKKYMKIILDNFQ